MIETFADSIDYLTNLGTRNLMHLMWLVVIFELPRYLFAALSAVLFMPSNRMNAAETRKLGRISVIIAGHNEQAALRKCVDSLHEQSLVPDEIVVVSDGSTDDTRAHMRALLREGRIHGAHNVDLRGGKSAGVNLAERLSSGDIIVNVDCDTTFDRHAIRNIVRPLADTKNGAVSGNIMVRNGEQSLLASLQSIEYLISISLGKRSLAMLDQVTCASGAFSAFRRTALDRVGGMDAAGGGEDLDVTLRLRAAGYGIAFASDALCYTDVPATLSGLFRQRMRWERDAVRLRYRTHINTMNPFSRRFNPFELFHEIEFLLFNVVGSAALPIYFIWLFWTFGDVAPVILGAAIMGAMLLDLMMFALAGLGTATEAPPRLLILLPLYSLFYGTVMRLWRLYAYIEEWIFSTSSTDEYVPRKVRMAETYE